MMSFDYFSSTNKGFGYQAEKNEPPELFNTHPNHDSTPFVLDCSGDLPESLEDHTDFDFQGDVGTGATSHHSLITGNNNHRFDSDYTTQQSPPHDHCPTRGPQRSTALRPHRAFPRRETVNPSISGKKLPTLEGRIDYKAEQQSAPPTRGVPQEAKSLRRKGKFNTVRNAPDAVPGKSVRRIRKVASIDTMRISSHQNAHHHKRGATNNPIMNDWTSRLDQLTLQQADPSLAHEEDFYSPSASTVTPGDVLRSPYNIQSPPLTPSLGHRKTVSEQALPRQSFQSPYHGMQSPYQAPCNNFDLFMQQSQQQQQQPQQHPPIPTSSIAKSNPFPSTPSNHTLRQQTTTPSSRHSRQAASWAPQAPASMNYNIVSPSQLHTNWEDTLQENEESYFNNALMTEPPHTAPLPDFTTPAFNYTAPPFTPFIDDNTINGLPTPSTQISFPFTNTKDNTPTTSHYQPFPLPQPTYPTTTILTSPPTLPSSHSHTHTPSASRPPSSSPPAPSTPPPARSTRLSSSKRRSKIGSLRLPKSASSLLSCRKTSPPSGPSTPHRPSLRTPKSASTLPSKTMKSPRSREGGGGGGGFGFVNFTPSDKGKILTGVAPSGSSKTKARREMEANERKRRLSLAAEKAVREAGGDWEGVRGVAGL